MNAYDFETLLIGFSLGVVARPFCRMMMERRADAERERRVQDRATALRVLAGLPAVSHELPRLGPVCPACGFYAVSDLRLERTSLARMYPCEDCLNGAVPGTIVPLPHPSRGVLPPRYTEQ